MDSRTIAKSGKVSGRRKKYRPRYHDMIKKAAFGVNFAVDETAYDMMMEYANAEGLTDRDEEISWKGRKGEYV